VLHVLEAADEELLAVGVGAGFFYDARVLGDLFVGELFLGGVEVVGGETCLEFVVAVQLV
jgi:hypothetical protein